MQVLGWDPAKKEGLFTNNFSNLDDGRAFAKNLNDEGADIVMPVAGPVGLGSAALAAELGVDTLKIIGVDVDQYVTDPEHKGVYLTSVLKKMDSTVQSRRSRRRMDGTFKGGVIVGTLKRGGVGLAPYPRPRRRRSRPSSRPRSRRSQQGIIDGSINVKGWLRPSHVRNIARRARMDAAGILSSGASPDRGAGRGTDQAWTSSSAASPSASAASSPIPT